MMNTTRDAIAEYITKRKGDEKQLRLAQLRLEYSEIGTLRNNFLAALRDVERIYPTILPTQASGRWSYLHPNLSGFSKKCINPNCPEYLHEKTKDCWAIRDCLRPDKNTFWIEHDLDAVEHRIYALILQWEKRLNDLKLGLDIHTPVTCSLFNLPLCSNLINPHTSDEDIHWRRQVQWRGKDDSRRTLSKNFTYGGQYFYVRLARRNERVKKPYRIYQGLWYNPSFVYTIPNIQSYTIIDDKPDSDTYNQLIPPDFETLAIRFVEDKENIEVQKKKAEVMEKYRKDKISRTLYGARRYSWFTNQETAKELFNHTIQGTVAGYINESAILIQKEFPDSWIIHNHHDSLKWAFPYTSSTENGKLEEETQILDQVKHLAQRTLIYGHYEIPLTATFSIKRRESI